jgi:hypothetical protein
MGPSEKKPEMRLTHLRLFFFPARQLQGLFGTGKPGTLRSLCGSPGTNSPSEPGGRKEPPNLGCNQAEKKPNSLVLIPKEFLVAPRISAVTSEGPDARCRGYDFGDCCPLEEDACEVLAPYEVPLHDGGGGGAHAPSPAIYFLRWCFRRVALPLLIFTLIVKALIWLIPG